MHYYRRRSEIEIVYHEHRAYGALRSHAGAGKQGAVVITMERVYLHGEEGIQSTGGIHQDIASICTNTLAVRVHDGEEETRDKIMQGCLITLM